jgi:hypothetical protein
MLFSPLEVFVEWLVIAAAILPKLPAPVVAPPVRFWPVTNSVWISIQNHGEAFSKAAVDSDRR